VGNASKLAVGQSRYSTVSGVDEPTPRDAETSSAPAPRPDEPTPEGAQTPSALDSAAATGEPPKKQGRSNEFWLAVLGLISTMIVGIVGGVVTWFSGAEHDKNSFTQETMRAQASFTQESQRAQASFTRAQQVAAYTAFTNAFDELALALGYQQVAIVTQYPYDIQIAPIPASKQDSETLYANFVNTMNVVAFSGSQHVQDVATKVLNKATDIKYVYADWNVNHPSHAATIPSKAEVTDFQHRTDIMLTELYKAEFDFNNAARADLGLPPLH
jgi:hypothetical protein